MWAAKSNYEWNRYKRICRTRIEVTRFDKKVEITGKTKIRETEIPIIMWHQGIITTLALFLWRHVFLVHFHPSLHFSHLPQGAGMANKGPSYGLSRQVQDKIDSKYDPELEQILVEWISRQCGSGVGKPEPGKQGFQAWLKDGCVSAQAAGCFLLEIALR